MKAQIFLSCGQSDQGRERLIAEAIKQRINEGELGFECWAACEEQDLDSLRDVVFKRLEEADYFIFVDFKREELKDRKAEDGSPIFRGSLFANQELAVASYIGLADRVLLLQEEGVEERNGLLSAVLANLKEPRETFGSCDRGDLPDRIYSLIEARLSDQSEDRKWTSQTRNALCLSSHAETKSKDNAQPFHIKVENLHHRKDARNCLAYLDEVVALDSNKEISTEWETVEFKWANTTLAAVRIAPKAYRLFDAFWLTHGSGGVKEMEFFHRETAEATTDYYPHRLPAGRYRLTYSVVSENFKAVQSSFNVEFKPGQPIKDALDRWRGANG